MTTPDLDPYRLHTKACLAHAVICAVENLRDTEGETDLDFRIGLQNNLPLQWADEYLRDGTATCKCPPPEWGQHTADRLPGQPDIVQCPSCLRHNSIHAGGSKDAENCVFCGSSLGNAQTVASTHTAPEPPEPKCDGLPLHLTTCPDRAAHM